MNSNVLVLYHAACSDGFGAAYAAWCKFGDTAEYVPVQYDNPPPDVKGRDVYILDFSYKRPVLERMKQDATSLLVLDHHKTAEADLAGLDYAIFDMGRSGCIIAWDYFHPGYAAPYGLYLIQDRDLWRFNLPETKAYAAALRAFIPMTFKEWALNVGADSATELAKRGEDLLLVNATEVSDLSKRSHRVLLNLAEGLACNAPAKHASELGNLLAEKSGTFGLVYAYSGRSKLWEYSLRSKGDYDVSEIAKMYGGGGHRNASGFSSKHLVWSRE